MSNLTLPNLSHSNLMRLLGNKQVIKLGYETRAMLDNDCIVITHHEHPIAAIGRDDIYLTTAGYNSSTTTARLHKVLVDNNLWPRTFGCAIRQGLTVVITPDTMRYGLTSVGRDGVTFIKADGEWLLDNDPRTVTA